MRIDRDLKKRIKKLIENTAAKNYGAAQREPPFGISGLNFIKIKPDSG